MKADKAGSYQLKQFIISDYIGRVKRQGQPSVDAKLLMGEWSLSESVNSDCLHGSASILDAVGLFYDFPLRGEEKLVIEYEDYFGNTLKHDFFIHAITNVKPAKDNINDALTYNIHFVSTSKLEADKKLIRRAYHGLISDSVKQVFDEHFEGTSISIEPTEGEQTLIVPSYTGTETMAFFARRAYGGSSTFRFYENRKGHHFKTIERAIGENKDVPVFILNQVKDETPEGQREKMNGIVDIKFGQPVDTLYDLYNGTYHKQSVELDYINRKAVVSDYRFAERFPDVYTDWGLVPNHSDEFAKRYLDAPKRMLMVQDYPDATSQNKPALRPKTYLPEVASDNWAINEQGKHNTLTIKIYGRNTIMAGSVVDVRIDEHRPPKRSEDKRFSGKYFVESVANEFYGDVYMQVLSLVRGGTNK